MTLFSRFCLKLVAYKPGYYLLSHLPRRSKTTAAINLTRSIEFGTVIPNILESNVAVSTDIGKREYQEDRYSIERLSKDTLFLGIFDGHGGSLAVDYTAEHLHQVTASLLKSKTHGIKDVLVNAFCEVNNNLLQHIRKNRPSKLHSKMSFSLQLNFTKRYACYRPKGKLVTYFTFHST